MEQKQDKALFPGQKKGLIKVLIKRGHQEQFVQSHFHFFEDEDDLSATKPKPKVNLVKKKVHEDRSEQLRFHLLSLRHRKQRILIVKSLFLQI